MLRLIGKICLLFLTLQGFLQAQDELDPFETETNCKHIFTAHFFNRHWGNGPSYSGSGSNLEQTATIRKKLPLLLKKYGCQSVLDAACGDYYWMKEVQLPIKDYIGVEVVTQLVDLNQRKFGDENRSFVAVDITKDFLPKVDCILCRDCLVHFSNADILKALKNFKKSGSKYLLTTSFVKRSSNFSIATGEWQPLNLLAAPFNLPAPIEILNEECTAEKSHWRDKSLLLWDLETIFP